MEMVRMERLTKRVGCGEAVPVADGNICAPFIKAGLCKTGNKGFPYSRWERHCNDTCVLGTIIDKLAAYEDTGLAPEDIVPVVRCKDCKQCNDVSAIPFIADSQKLVCMKGVNWRAVEPNHFCSYGERREGK